MPLFFLEKCPPPAGDDDSLPRLTAMMLVALMMLAAGQCPMVMRDTAYGPGGVVVPGVGTLEECCGACVVAVGCRTWVWDNGCRLDPPGRPLEQRGASAGTMPESPCVTAIHHLCVAARAASKGNCFVCAQKQGCTMSEVEGFCVGGH